MTKISSATREEVYKAFVSLLTTPVVVMAGRSYTLAEVIMISNFASAMADAEDFAQKMQSEE